MFRRFLRSQRALTEADAEEMLRLDDKNVTSLIAILQKDHNEQAIGEARYVTDSSGKLAEAAEVIADEWQNLGLGTALFSSLLAEAKKQGLSKILAYDGRTCRRSVSDRNSVSSWPQRNPEPTIQ
jgi:acetyltransferase